MTSMLTVPSSLEEIVLRYDGRNEPFTEHDIGGELKAARSKLVDPPAADNLGAWAEVLAFALTPARGAEDAWGTHFGPMGSGVTAEGQKVYFPDVAGTPESVVPHWAHRARNLKNPYLKARYADMAWDMSVLIGKRKRDPQDARIAIDSYIDAVPRIVEAHERLTSVIRALDLAVTLSDKERTERARRTLLELHSETMKANDGLWWFTVDRLIEDKKSGVADEERAQLVSDLEALLALFSDTSNPEAFSPHAAESAASRLITHYMRTGQYDAFKRVNETVGRAFEHAASLGDAMVGSAFLQTALDAYREAGLADESRRVRILMQQKIGDAKNEMKPIGHEIKISKEDMEKFVDGLIVDDLGQSFVTIAVEFLLKRPALEEAVQKTLKEAPLMAHITQSIMADDRVAAKIGSVEEDPFGRLFQQARFTFAFSTPWLAQAFHRLFERHEVVPEHFVGWGNRHKLFDDTGLLLQGVKAFFHRDNVKAVHVLVPQIERGLRKIADQLEIPVTKAYPKVAGTSVAIGMGDILYSETVAAALGPNVVLQALYADPRGLNLRNEVAHGLMEVGAFHEHTARLIIHTLLVLGLWRELGKRP